MRRRWTCFNAASFFLAGEPSTNDERFVQPNVRTSFASGWWRRRIGVVKRFQNRFSLTVTAALVRDPGGRDRVMPPSGT
jgi:hypothetical protein